MDFTIPNNRSALGPQRPCISKARGIKLWLFGSTRFSYTPRFAASAPRAAPQRSETDLCVLSAVVHPTSVVVTSSRRSLPWESTPGRAISGRRSHAVSVTRSRSRFRGSRIGFRPAWAQNSWSLSRVLSWGITRWLAHVLGLRQGVQTNY